MTSSTLRAGNRDRERTAQHLGQALAQGYLTLDEYEARLQTAFAAHTLDELDRLVADLPLERIRRHDPARRAARSAAARRSIRGHLAGYLAMVAIVLSVWLAVGVTAGSWYFWPVWPILGAGIGLAAHVTSVRFGARSDRPGHPRPKM